MKKMNKKGFTLIELLVVVAIIAILAGIVLVSLNSARDRSKKASLQSTVASVMPVVAMCVNDGGTVQAPTVLTTGAGSICSLADIDEEWPGLAHITGAGYSYITIDDGADATDVITAGTTGVGGAVIVSCSMATGSCTLP